MLRVCSSVAMVGSDSYRNVHGSTLSVSIPACWSALQLQVGNEAEAQIRFQELQHAYAVLSDAHERKWYDDHRDEILNPARYGGDGDTDDGAGGRTVNVTPFFR